MHVASHLVCYVITQPFCYIFFSTIHFIIPLHVILFYLCESEYICHIDSHNKDILTLKNLLLSEEIHKKLLLRSNISSNLKRKFYELCDSSKITLHANCKEIKNAIHVYLFHSIHGSALNLIIVCMNTHYQQKKKPSN